MDLHTSLSKVNGIGPVFAKRLAKLELFTVNDLLSYYPFRYEDFSKISKISEAKTDEKVTIRGEVWQIKNAYTKFRKTLTQAIINDGSTSINLTWFNQPYLTQSIKSGDTLQVAGKISLSKGKPSLIAPDWEKVWGTNPGIHTGRLVPIYSETFGVSSKWIRSLVYKVLPLVLEDLADFMPDFIRQDLIPLTDATQNIHFPQNLHSLTKARDRLAFDELFLLQLTALQTRYLWNKKTLIKSWSLKKTELSKFIKQLSFELTNAQNKVIAEILADLQRPHPMNRLVQGEVGSGKTVVAAVIIYLAHLNNFQTLFMAPTEILAWQHYNTLQKLLAPFNIEVGIYTGSKKFTKDQKINPQVIVGTHALLSDKLKLDKVGLVVIDEQHRFGVQQRALLRQKGTAPHFLTMTATPIPRSIALTFYGDLDLSIIDEMPKNRQLIKTYVVPEKKRPDAYKFIEKQIQAGDQVYIITPLIEESETLASTKAAKVEYERLQKIFSKLKLGLLHGKMKPKEKETVLEQFRVGEIQLLVSTSVVEVGVDVPNATIMVIEGAERFGLAQLHQLRGRVGRGVKQSYCLLFTSNGDAKENRRLKYLETTFNGLKLAELDLDIRGAGTVYGTAQHGKIDLQLAKLTDLTLVEKTKNAAQTVLNNDPALDKYPPLKAKLSSLVSNVTPD